ncbi:MAG: diphthine--ammonia ligase [Candidatus Omnitrophota bacterium]
MKRGLALSSWSGGKDSGFACYKAMQMGYEVKYLLNFISREHKRCCFHGIAADLIKLQAKLVGIPLIQKEVTADMQEYEKEFKEAVSEIRDKGIENMVFGDIYLNEQKNWVDRVSNDIGMRPIEPLWNKDTEKIIEDFIDVGFKSVVVSCKADIFGKDFVGRIIDRKLLKELKEKNICPCGENGEFHTFLVDGPFFKEKIEITRSESVLKAGFWKYYFLDIKEYKTVQKQ